MASGHENTWQKFDGRHCGILRKQTVAVLMGKWSLKWTIERQNRKRPLKPYLDRKELDWRNVPDWRYRKPRLYLSLVNFNSAQAKCFKPGSSAILSGFCQLSHKWNIICPELRIYSEVQSKVAFSKERFYFSNRVVFALVQSSLSSLNIVRIQEIRVNHRRTDENKLGPTRNKLRDTHSFTVNHLSTDSTVTSKFKSAPALHS